MMDRNRIRSVIIFFSCFIVFTSGVFQLSCKSEPSPTPIPSQKESPKSPTPSPTPSASPEPQDTLEPPQQDDESSEDFIERHIVVDDQNNVFSIGVPAGMKEETEIVASEPIDFWFQYLPEEVILVVNEIPVQRSDRWEFKIRQTTGVTSFKYVVKNPTPQYASYNLHLVPTTEGHTVTVTVLQRWIPLGPNEK